MKPAKGKEEAVFCCPNPKCDSHKFRAIGNKWRCEECRKIFSTQEIAGKGKLVVKGENGQPCQIKF